LDDSYDTEVYAVLLSFGMLNKAQRHAFAEQFNRFTWGSAQLQRRLMQQWSGRCRDDANPMTRMIAESSAVYVATPRKRRGSKKPSE